MIRRFNYTDRLRILREDVDIQLARNSSEIAFNARLSLDEYDLPSDALVFVEAYRQTSWMRFDFGTVGTPTTAGNHFLTEFDSPDDILFRVKVTQANDIHVLLAEADRVSLKRPSEDADDRIPLLPVKPHPLGDEIYRVDFSDGSPRLLVNNGAGDWRAIVKSPAFASLTYPAVFREVLTRILMIEKHDDSTDVADWRSLWLKLSESLPAVRNCPSGTDPEDEKLDWIDTAVQAFAAKMKNLAKFGEYWKKEDE